MKNNIKIAAFLCALGLSTSPFAMELEDDRTPTKLDLVLEREMSLALPKSLDLINFEDASSTEIIAKSFAYGFIKGTVEEMCTSFEYALHNILVTRGVDGVSQLFGIFGGFATDQAVKLSINMSIKLLVSAATAPVDSPGAALKVLNAMTILDGILARTIMDRLNEKIDGVNHKISKYVGGKLSVYMAQTLKPYAQDDTKKLFLCGGEVVVNFATQQLVKKALTQATQEIQMKMKDYVEAFIAESDYTRNYKEIIFPIFDVITKGSGYNLNDATGFFLLSQYPLCQAKAQLEKGLCQVTEATVGSLVRNLVSPIGTFLSNQGGRVIASYVSHEIADRYIDGMGIKLAGKLLDTPMLAYLESYTMVPQEVYLQILGKEIALKEVLRDKAKKLAELEQLNHELGEVALLESQQMVEGEKQYELAYIEAYAPINTSRFQTYIVGPSAYVVGSVWSGMTKIAQGANALVQGTQRLCASAQDFINVWFDWASTKTHEKITPVFSMRMGHAISTNMTHGAFVLMAGKLGYNREEAHVFLTRKVEKDWYYDFGKKALSTGKLIISIPYVLNYQINSLAYQIDTELQLAANEGWVSPFHPE